MALSDGDLLAKHFILSVNMSLVNLFIVGLLAPSILSMPHFVKRQIPVTTTVSSETTMDVIETTMANEDLEGTTEAPTTDELPAETTESFMTTEGEPIQDTTEPQSTTNTTESSLATPMDTTSPSVVTEGEPMDTTIPSIVTEGEAMGTTELMATNETQTDAIESSTAEVLVEGSSAIIVIPIDMLSNLTDITNETELNTPMTISMRKKRSVLDEDSVDKHDKSNSAEAEEISPESVEDNDKSATESTETDDSENSETGEDSTEEVTETEELENSASNKPQGPYEVLSPLLNRLPTWFLPPITVGNSEFLSPLMIRQPVKPQVTEIFHDLPTNDKTEHFDSGIDLNQESGFNAINYDPQFTDKVNYENFPISEDPDVYFFDTIFYNFVKKLQNIIYELKARKTIDSKGNIHILEHTVNENMLENDHTHMQQPNHDPSSTKAYFVTLKMVLGLTEKETPRDIPSRNYWEKEAFYNV